MKKFTVALVAAMVLILLPSAALAGPEVDVISDEEKATLVETVCERIKKIYAFTENIQKTCDFLKSNLKQGDYAKYGSPREFAARLNQDLESVTHDKHFGITYDPQQAAAMAEQAGGSSAFYTPQMVRQYRRMNYGFKELKILEGNVGYLDLRDFFPLKWAATAGRLRCRDHRPALQRRRRGLDREFSSQLFPRSRRIRHHLQYQLYAFQPFLLSIIHLALCAGQDPLAHALVSAHIQIHVFRSRGIRFSPEKPEAGDVGG
jgi:hypothetical protein